MSEASSHTTHVAARPMAIAAAVVALLLAGTGALWAHYGTAVFYEMILAGIAMCF